MANHPLLFTPAALRRVKLRNRIVISPMCASSATHGLLDDWHLCHLGKFAQAVAGLTFNEAAAVAKDARTTHSDQGTAYRQIDLPTTWKHPS